MREFKLYNTPYNLKRYMSFFKDAPWIVWFNDSVCETIENGGGAQRLIVDKHSVEPVKGLVVRPVDGGGVMHGFINENDCETVWLENIEHSEMFNILEEGELNND